jgi:hypothetical protein
MRRPIGVTLMAILFAALAFNGLVQVAYALRGDGSDPGALTVFQLLSGLTALAAGAGAWRNSRWSSIAAVGYGVVTSVMLALLPRLLGLGEDERLGVWSGAAVVLLFGVAAGWYLHRQHPRSAASA